MIRIMNVRLPLGYGDEDIRAAAARALRVEKAAIESVSLYRRSIDARKKHDVHFVTALDVTLHQNESTVLSRAKNKNAARCTPYRYDWKKAKDRKKRVAVIGMGPAGLFCALTLARGGLAPILIERGCEVEERAKKVERFFLTGELDTECNVQFGEGGAGTFSDGKLNTGTKDHRARQVLNEFAFHGAPEEILVDAKPHIGTDRLRETLISIRKELTERGASILFNTKVVDFSSENGAITQLTLEKDGRRETLDCDAAVLAIGHSARDTFELLKAKGIWLEPKPFSVGVRVEHLQEKINVSCYGAAAQKLPAASYKLSAHLKDGRGVYSFCMCPGGEVVAATSEKNAVVTNGMSAFAREKMNANAAMLVSVTPDDIPENETLKGMYFQRELEKKAYQLGGGDYRAPVQRVEDFLSGNNSVRFGEVLPSYERGTTFAKTDDVLPPFLADSLKEAFPLFERKLKGFSHPDALMTAVETRSSSPVRIVRDEQMVCVSVKGLYPCGEGAGYAGGIISAAVDGMKVAEAILES